MSATATKKRPRRAAGSDGQTRSVAEIEKELRDEPVSWDMDERDKLSVRIRAAERELDIAQLAAMPKADPLIPKAKDADIPLDTIELSGNHRETEDDIERLARQIEQVGLQQRIGLREIDGRRFELIWGSRRRLAMIKLGWKLAPARVFPAQTTPDQVELLRDIENFGRKDLTPVERAIAVARTIDKVAGRAEPRTEDGRQLMQCIDDAGGLEAYVGQLLCYPAEWVRDHSYVSRLGGSARSLLAARRLTIEKARELAKLADRQRSDELAIESASRADGTGGQSIHWLRARVADELLSLKSVPWRLDAKFPKKGDCLGVACDGCQFNSKSDPKLFEHDADDDGEDPAGLQAAGVCRNRSCFEAKRALAEAAIAEGLKKVAAAAKKSDEAIPLTEKGLADLTPDTVRGSTFARKAKATIDPVTGGAGKQAAAKSRGEPGRPAKSPERAAREKYAGAMAAWQAGASKKIIGKISGDPMRAIYLILLGEARLLENLRGRYESYTYYGSNDKHVAGLHKSDDARNDKARHLVTAGEMKSLVARMAAPTLEDLVAVAKRLRKSESRELEDLVDSAIEAFAAAVGVKLDPPPDLAALLPGDKAKAGAVKPPDVERMNRRARAAVDRAIAETREPDDDEGFQDDDE